MVSKFRLLMTTDVQSEIWNYALTLSKALLKHINAEILIISLGGKPADNQIKEAEHPNIKLQFTDFSPDLLAYDGKNSYISEIKSLFEIAIKEFNPHVLHFNHAYAGFDFKTPCVFACHDNLADKNILKYREFIDENLNKVDIITTQSRFFAEYLIKTYNFKKEIRVIYNGVENKLYSDIPKSPILLSNLNILDQSKNINLLLNIAYKLPVNIKVKVVGEWYQDRKLPRNVEFLGNLSGFELEEVYKNASIYLALSNYESNGLSSIRAAYSGCAILANDIPVFKELWGDCAYIFEKNNINSLMRGINNLIENKNLFEITSRNCRAKALSAFNSKRMAYEYINLYKSILRKRQTVEKTSKESSSKVFQDSKN